MPARSPDDLLPLSQDVLFILLSLADGDQHGYAIMRDAEARSSGSVRLQTGALYRTLKRLLADGLVAEAGAPPDAESDPRRRYYGLTAFGRDVLEADVERMAALVRVARGGRMTRRTRLA